MKKLEITTKSYFGDIWAITSDQYHGVDFSKYCFIFQGQGGVVPGMLYEFYKHSIIAQEKFIIADRITESLGIGAASLYVTSPSSIQKETLHLYGIIALHVLEVALFEEILLRGIKPSMLTSHSFGEYAMLVAAGVISFEDMVRIVCQREIFSEKPNELGFLVALKSKNQDIQTYISDEDGYYISSINSFHQAIIAVTESNLSLVVKKFEEQDVDCFVLRSVPQPYHSPLMNNTQEKFMRYVDSLDITINPPSIDFFSSVSCSLVTRDSFSEGKIRDILKGQLVKNVYFLSQIVSIYNLGICNFLEIGSKNIFSKLLGDILIDKEYKSTFSGDMFLEVHKKENKKRLLEYNKVFIDTINAVIGKITGYNLVTIKLEDRFQEDMGIDSIKKANILFKVLDDLAINNNETLVTSEIKTVEDLLEYLDSDKKREDVTQKKERVFAFSRYRLDSYPKETSTSSTSFSVVYRSNLEDLFEKKESFVFGKNKDSILVLTIRKTLSAEGVLRSIYRIKELIQCDGTLGNIMIVSHDDFSGSVLYSFFKSLKRENSLDFLKHVYIENALYSDSEIDAIIQKEIEAAADTSILYTKKGRHALGMIKEEGLPEEQKFLINKESVFVVIGGASGATYSILKRLLLEYGCFVCIVGRSNQENVSGSLAELESTAPGKVRYYSANILKKGALEEVFSDVYKKYGKIDVCINGAGVLDINFLHNKEEEILKNEFNTKVTSSLEIVDLAKKYSLKKVVLFSSIISYFGSSGQSVYGAANMFLNGLCRDTDNADSIVNVINWPAWNNVGMTENANVLHALKEFENPLIDEDDAYTLFKKDLLLTKSSSSYYLTNTDEHSMNFLLANAHRFTSLLGTCIDRKAIGLSSVDFIKTLDKVNDFFLRDHIVLGNHTLPAAYYIVSTLTLSHLYFKNSVTLRNVIILNVLTVGEKKDMISTLTIQDEGVTVSTKAVSNLFSATAVSGEISNVDSTSLEFNSVGTLWNLVEDSVYDYFEKDGTLLYGPCFKTLEEVSMNQEGVIRGRINYSRTLEKVDGDFFSSLIPVIDACFQLFVVAGKSYSMKVLPKSVDMISFFEGVAVTKYLELYIKNITADEDGISGDVYIINEKGQSFCVLLGMRLHKIIV